MAIRALGGDAIPATVNKVAVVWFLCDLATAGALAWAWGAGAAAGYLMPELRLLPKMSLRLDPSAVTLEANA